MKKDIKQLIIEDIIKCNEEYKKETKGDNLITRDYYRSHSQYKEKEVNKHFGSFSVLLEEALGKQGIDIIQFKKKLHILENENKNLKQENQDLIKHSIIEDIILSKYEERLNKGLVITGNKNIKIPPYQISTINKEAILVISDTHLGEIITALELNGINEYNSSIMVERLDRIFYYFIHYCQKYKIEIANIFLLGDLLSGCHHEELLRSNEFDDVTATFFLQEYFCNKFIEIEKHFKEIKVEILVGNHSRIPEGKPQFKQASKLNYEYILARQLDMFFTLLQKDNKKPKIKINVNESLFKVVEVAGRRFLLTHGHILSNGSNSFAGIPYYGLAQSSSKMDGAFKQFEHLHFTDIIMGHLHALSKVKTPQGNLYINGSVVGTGEYSLFKMKLTGTPEQLMLVIEDGFVNAEITLRG